MNWFNLAKKILGFEKKNEGTFYWGRHLEPNLNGGDWKKIPPKGPPLDWSKFGEPANSSSPEVDWGGRFLLDSSGNKYLLNDALLVRCPNCLKVHSIKEFSSRMTCVCNYVFDPRKEK